MSFIYFDSIFLSFDLTYLSRSMGMELAPCYRFLAKQVVKASSGHIPQPFLISNIKNLSKDKPWNRSNSNNDCKFLTES